MYPPLVLAPSPVVVPMRLRGSSLRVPQLAGCQVPRATNELMLFALFSAFGSLANRRHITWMLSKILQVKSNNAGVTNYCAMCNGETLVTLLFNTSEPSVLNLIFKSSFIHSSNSMSKGSKA